MGVNMNKPVAWAYIKDGEFWDAIHPDEHAQEEGSYTIPLYTHPVKELTDEEILSCWHEYGQILTIQQIRIHFARAILRKAIEK